MKKYISGIVILIICSFILSGLIVLLEFWNKRKDAIYLDRIDNLDAGDVQKIVCNITLSRYCQRRNASVEIKKVEDFIISLKSNELISNQSSRLGPVEIYEVTIFLKDEGEQLCFTIFDSKTYDSGVVRFINCSGLDKISDVKNQKILEAMHQICMDAQIDAEVSSQSVGEVFFRTMTEK